MTLVTQNTYPIVERALQGTSGEVYAFQFAYFGSFEVQVEVCASLNRNQWVILPSAGYYVVTRTGAGTTPGGTVTITNPSAADDYLRQELGLKYPESDFSAATYDYVAIARKIDVSQTQAQTLSYSGSKVETSDDRIVMIIQQIHDMLLALYNLQAIWDLEYSKLTRNYLPKCNVTDTMELVNSTISDDGEVVFIQNNVDITGVFNADGAATLGSTLDVSGATHLKSTLQVDDTSTLQAVTATTITTSGNVSVGGALGVGGAATLNNTLLVKGNATFENPAFFQGTVDIEGVLRAHDILATSLTTTGGVNVGGVLFCSSTSEFVGASVFRNNLDTYGVLWARGVFNATGVATFYNNVTVQGSTTTQALSSTNITTPQLTSTGNITFGTTCVMDGITFYFGQMSETIQNSYVMKAADRVGGGYNFYWAPDANDGTGEPDPNAPPLNVVAVGDGLGSVTGSELERDPNLELFRTPWRFLASVLEAQYDLSIGRNLILDTGIYGTERLEGTYAQDYYLKVTEDGVGNRQLEWSEVVSSGGGEFDVSPNVLAMGKVDGTLGNSQLTQDPLTQRIETGYGLASRDIRLQASIAGGATIIGSQNTQSDDWRVFFDFRGLSTMSQGDIMPLWCRYYGANTISIFAGTELSPTLLVREPAIDDALAIWEGHDSEFENQFIASSTPTILFEKKIKYSEFADELLITSHANFVEQVTQTTGLINIDTTLASTFRLDFSGATTLQLLGTPPNGHSITLSLRPTADNSVITWSTAWRWAFNTIPNTTRWATGYYVTILLTKNNGVIFAERVTTQALQVPDTTVVQILGTHRDNAPLNYFDDSGYLLESVERGQIFGNTLKGLAIDSVCIVKSTYAASRSVTIANNVLDIVFGAETEWVVKVQHDEDISAINVTFDADEIPTNVVIRFTLIIKKGLSTQIAIPLPNGVKAPAILETDELVLGNFTHTVFQFFTVPGNGAYYLGATGVW